MRPILARVHAEVLARFARADALVALDFDGTLAPIVDDRDRAAMRPATRDLLAAVCARYPCAVISGRGRDDVARRLGGAPVQYVVGNHGAEPSAAMVTFEQVVESMRARLATALAGVPTVEIEDKRYSLAIHFRRSRGGVLTQAAGAIAAAIADLPVRARVVAGKRVVNVLPQDAPHKGVALASLQSTAGAEVALYVGDDVTDEDVFELEQPGRLIGVRVGRRRSSAASFYIRDQGQIDALLASLVERRATAGRRATGGRSAIPAGGAASGERP